MYQLTAESANYTMAHKSTIAWLPVVPPGFLAEWPGLIDQLTIQQVCDLLVEQLLGVVVWVVHDLVQGFPGGVTIPGVDTLDPNPTHEAAFMQYGALWATGKIR
jgi:hypothetical protein